MSLASLLFDSPRAPDDVVVHAGEDHRTLRRLQRDAGTVADRLGELGVAAGRPVAVMLPNGADVVATLFGVWRAGGVYVPVNPRLTDTEVGRILDTVDPVVVVTTPDLRSRAGGRPLLLFGGDGRGTGNGPVAEEADDRTPGRAPFDPDVALVQFTSGTTGAPKAVLLTHSGVLELIDGVLASITGDRPTGARPTGDRAGRPPTTNIVPVSLSLWAGIYNVLFAFRTGAPVAVMAAFDPVDFAELVARFDVRSSVLPPAAIAALATDERVTALPPLRFVRSITAPLSPLHARRFHDRFGIAVLNGYGQTEIGGEIVGWSAADWRGFGDTKLGSVGRPHPGVSLRVAEPSGELQVQTPALAAGYLDGSDFGDRLTPDGWFRTGDVGRVDEDGFVWIDGRVSDMINRGGLKVHPGEVEEVLLLSPAVAEVAVVGAPDDRLGEVPVAFVVPAAGGDLPEDELRALCRTHLAPYKVPVRFLALDALPRNEIGKVVRAGLVAAAADGAGAGR